MCFNKRMLPFHDWRLVHFSLRQAIWPIRYATTTAHKNTSNLISKPYTLRRNIYSPPQQILKKYGNIWKGYRLDTNPFMHVEWYGSSVHSSEHVVCQGMECATLARPNSLGVRVNLRTYLPLALLFVIYSATSLVCLEFQVKDDQ